MMTKDDILKTFECIASSGMDTAPFAKTSVLRILIGIYDQMSDEEKDAFPEDFALDINLLADKGLVNFMMKEQLIEDLKEVAVGDLHPSCYRNSLPYYRTQYAFLYSLICQHIVYATPDDNGEKALWIYRGLEAIETVLDICNRTGDLDLLRNALDVKVDLLKNKSIKEAISCVESAIIYGGTYSEMEKYSSLWKELNELRFNKYFDTEDDSFLCGLPLSDELKDEICKQIPELHKTCFCNVEPYYDRNTILIVNDILDIVREDLKESAEEAQYIFEIGRIPADVKFAEGQPKCGVLYNLDENKLDLYHQNNRAN